MNEITKDLIIRKYISKEIRLETLVERYPNKIDDNYFSEEIDTILLSRNSNEVEYFLYFFFNDFSLSSKIILKLCQLLFEGWHYSHEDIVLLIQNKCPIPEAVDYLDKAIIMKHQVLIDNWDYEPFVRKCMYALRAINTDHSWSVIRKYAAPLVLR